MEIALALTAVTAVVVTGAYLHIRQAVSPQTHPLPTSPLDSAERILANRYARGLISPDEYERMTAILRR